MPDRDPPKGLQERGEGKHAYEGNWPYEPCKVCERKPPGDEDVHLYRMPTPAPQGPEGDVEVIRARWPHPDEWTGGPDEKYHAIHDIATLLAALSAEKEAHAETRRDFMDACNVIDAARETRHLPQRLTAALAAYDARTILEAHDGNV